MSQTEHEQSARAPAPAAPAAPVSQAAQVTGAQLLTYGVVELRKRRELAAPRAGGDTGGPLEDPLADPPGDPLGNPLEAVARRSAERIAAEGRPCA